MLEVEGLASLRVGLGELFFGYYERRFVVSAPTSPKSLLFLPDF